MRRAPVDLERSLRKAIEGLASYKMVPAIHSLPDAFGSLPIGHSNMNHVFAPKSCAKHSASG